MPGERLCPLIVPWRPLSNQEHKEALSTGVDGTLTGEEERGGSSGGQACGLCFVEVGKADLIVVPKQASKHVCVCLCVCAHMPEFLRVYVQGLEVVGSGICPDCLKDTGR